MDYDTYREVAQVRFDGGSIDGRHWTAIWRLKTIRLVRMTNVEMGPLRPLDHWKVLDGVSGFDLRGSRIDDRHLELVLRLPSIRYLNLNSTAVSAKGLALLKQLPQLRELHLKNTNAFAEEIKLLRQDLPDCDVRSR